MTKQAEQLLSEKRSLESELEALENSNEPEQFQTEIRTLQSEINSMNLCDRCDGEGEVIAHSNISSRSIDVPYKLCPICRGSGITE